MSYDFLPTQSDALLLIVKSTIGNIQPIGETNADEKAYDNLSELIQLVEYLVHEIRQVAEKADDPRHSISLCGTLAKESLEEL